MSATRAVSSQGLLMVFSGRAKRELTEKTTDIVHAARDNAGRSGIGGFVTAIASALALIFSAVSLYHSVLKQPELHFHVSPVVHYTRDSVGNLEVFAVPLTVSNHGARDATILDVELTAQSLAGGPSKKFYSAYKVDGDFFIKPGAFDAQRRRFERVDRPKEPFAPISVAGRSNFTGTLLFYKKDKAFPKVISDTGQFAITLRLNTNLDRNPGPLEDFFTTAPAQISKRLELTQFSETRLLRGSTHQLIDIDWKAR
ncbi:MAG: hypothetical protein AAGG72_05385 [Pseudomonadota bacterium]